MLRKARSTHGREADGALDLNPRPEFHGDRRHAWPGRALRVGSPEASLHEDGLGRIDHGAGSGDPPVHARSAALGDTIAAGTDRYYFVYYRDPTVLGGCSSTATLNATQAGKVTWGP